MLQTTTTWCASVASVLIGVRNRDEIEKRNLKEEGNRLSRKIIGSGRKFLEMRFKKERDDREGRFKYAESDKVLNFRWNVGTKSVKIN